LKTLRWKVLLGMGLLLAMSVVPAARADTIYDYTGNGMTPVIGLCTSCSITASFDLSAALPSDYSGAALAEIPVSYTITAGSLSLTNANSTLVGGALDVYSTDANGDPTSWTFVANNAAGYSLSSNTLSLTADIAVGSNFSAGNTGDAGTWVDAPVAPAPTPTPEPTSLAMLGSGMLGLLGVAYRRLRVALA